MHVHFESRNCKHVRRRRHLNDMRLKGRVSDCHNRIETFQAMPLSHKRAIGTTSARQHLYLGCRSVHCSRAYLPVRRRLRGGPTSSCSSIASGSSVTSSI